MSLMETGNSGSRGDQRGFRSKKNVQRIESEIENIMGYVSKPAHI